MPLTARALQRRIRVLLWVFIVGIAVSGATALPLGAEVRWLVGVLSPVDRAGLAPPGLLRWLTTVRNGLLPTYARYPFIAYGTDWLAFGHFVIALAFIGPLRDPVRNRWVIDFGLLACLLVVPFALVAGAVRGIPFGWRLIDCSFGAGGAVPLWLCRRYVGELAAALGTGDTSRPPGTSAPSGRSSAG